MAQRLLHGVIDAKILEADLSIMSGGLFRPKKVRHTNFDRSYYLKYEKLNIYLKYII
jgi:hypothetical protein